MTVNQVLSMLEKKYTERREKAEKEADIRKNKIHSELPEIRDIDIELASTGDKIMATIVGSHKDPKAALDSIKQENDLLVARRKSILRSAGYPENYTDPQYCCSLCRDSGYIYDKMCDCLKLEFAEAMLVDSGLSALAKSQSFDNFDVTLFPEECRENAASNLEFCKSYADEFKGKESPNLLMVGTTGLGKTHLSTSIAKEIIKKGYTVVYAPISTIIADFSSLKYGMGGEDDERISKYFESDLLIIDDLGTELSTAYSVSVIYNLINTRICKGMPMIISSNLTAPEIRSQYQDRITSRLFGNFDILKFEGCDIRMVLKTRK